MSNIVAMTGHRPEKIAFEKFTRSTIAKVFEQNKVDTVVNGLAAGIDLWSAFEAIKLGIPVISARPWAGHKPRTSDQKLYEFVVNNSQEVVNVCEDMEYDNRPWLYQKRNEWMVDYADKVFAIWDGTSGGTKNCFEYALGKKPILRYKPGHGFSVYNAEGKLVVSQ